MKAMKPETSFEFIETWFVKAKHQAKNQGRNDSAKLWEDGIEHLRYYKDLSESLQTEIKELREALQDLLDRPDNQAFKDKAKQALERKK